MSLLHGRDRSDGGYGWDEVKQISLTILFYVVGVFGVFGLWMFVLSYYIYFKLCCFLISYYFIYFLKILQLVSTSLLLTRLYIYITTSPPLHSQASDSNNVPQRHLEEEKRSTPTDHLKQGVEVKVASLLFRRFPNSSIMIQNWSARRRGELGRSFLFLLRRLSKPVQPRSWKGIQFGIGSLLRRLKYSGLATLLAIVSLTLWRLWYCIMGKSKQMCSEA